MTFTGIFPSGGQITGTGHQERLPIGPEGARRLRGIHCLVLACLLMLVPGLMLPLLHAEVTFPVFTFCFAVGVSVAGLCAGGWKPPVCRLSGRCLALLIARSCALLAAAAVFLFAFTEVGIGRPLFPVANPQSFADWCIWMLDLTPLCLIMLAAAVCRETIPLRRWLAAVAVVMSFALTLHLLVLPTPFMPLHNLTSLGSNPLPAVLLAGAALYLVLSRMLTSQASVRCLLLWDGLTLLGWFACLAARGVLSRGREWHFAELAIFGGPVWFWPDFWVMGLLAASGGLAQFLLLSALRCAPLSVLAPFLALKSVFYVLLAAISGIQVFRYSGHLIKRTLDDYSILVFPSLDPDAVVAAMENLLNPVLRGYGSGISVVSTVYPAAIVLVVLLLLYWRERVAARGDVGADPLPDPEITEVFS